MIKKLQEVANPSEANVAGKVRVKSYATNGSSAHTPCASTHFAAPDAPTEADLDTDEYIQGLSGSARQSIHDLMKKYVAQWLASIT